MNKIRNWWTPEHLREAAKLLDDAANHLGVSHPHAPHRPNPHTLPAVQAMIAAAQDCIKAAQPTQGGSHD